MRIDLNADVGEGTGHDAELIPLVTSVNIACGAHAGDPAGMAQAVELARRHSAAIGAHPGYPDREGFGRRELAMAPDELTASLLAQLEALVAVVAAAGLTMGHVKPHGALYNQAARDRALAAIVAQAVRQSDPSLTLVGLAGSALLEAGREAGLAVASEAFADRAYEADGSLRSRTLAGAMMQTPEAAAEQALSIVRSSKVTSYDGQTVRVAADTLCIHGDTPGAAEYARHVRRALELAGVTVAPFDAR
jgi:5-oxoprolinase (ATP-hydrolysing) subunit A